MIELKGVFFIKYKKRDSRDVWYGVHVGEDDKFFETVEGKFNNKFYHYQRITEEEYFNAPENRRGFPRDERDS